MGILDNIVRIANQATGRKPADLNQLMQQPQAVEPAEPMPRDPNYAVPFTPGFPIRPAAINELDPETGRPRPRQYEYNVSHNIQITETRPVPFGVLRTAADQIDILRRCIEVVKNKVLASKWDVVLSPDVINQLMADNNVSQIRAAALAKTMYADQITKARKFWQTPDVINGLIFEDWLEIALEDILVLDAWAIFPVKSVGGDLIALQIIDGATIRPYVDARGMKPQPPYPAYAQMLYGFPRSEFTMPTETEDKDGQFTSDELSYVVFNRRVNSVYGYGPVERSLNVADLYLRRQQWMRAEYTDGVIPELFLETTAEIPAELLRQYEIILNDDLAGQTEQRKRARILPYGMKASSQDGYAEKLRNMVFDEYIVHSIVGHFGGMVQPSEIGFTAKGGLGGGGVQTGEANTADLALQGFTNRLARQLSQLMYVYLGVDRALQFQFKPSDRQDDGTHAKSIDLAVRGGKMSINEARAEDGLSLLDSPVADAPLLVTTQGTFMITNDGAVALNPAPDAPAPVDNPVDNTKSARPADIQEIIRFKKWLKKSPTKPFQFNHVPSGFAETLNKFVAVGDHEGAAWYAERYSK